MSSNTDRWVIKWMPWSQLVLLFLVWTPPSKFVLEKWISIIRSVLLLFPIVAVLVWVILFIWLPWFCVIFWIQWVKNVFIHSYGPLGDKCDFIDYWSDFFFKDCCLANAQWMGKSFQQSLWLPTFNRVTTEINVLQIIPAELLPCLVSAVSLMVNLWV